MAPKKSPGLPPDVKSREAFFLEKIAGRPIPAHVAIIADGNGRWARRRKLPRIAGHRAGAKAIRATVETATEVGVKYLTLYTFSTENWRRPSGEVGALMSLFEEQLRNEIDELNSEGVRIKVLGHLEELPATTQAAFRQAMELTATNERLNLNIALNYGSRTEILDAINQIVSASTEGRLTGPVDEELLSEHLYTAGMPDPELLIRTSGEFRISNFLLWQIAYTEIWTTPALWPDFGRLDFLQAIYDFQRRERRFGGLNP